MQSVQKKAVFINSIFFLSVLAVLTVEARLYLPTGEPYFFFLYQKLENEKCINSGQWRPAYINNKAAFSFFGV